MDNHLFDAISVKAARPSRRFIVADDGAVVTYGDMMEQTARLAHALVVSGVESGDRVAAQVEKGVEIIMLYLACLRAGAVFLPLNTAYTASEVAYFINDSEPRIVVVDPARASAIAPLAAAVGADVLTLGGDGSGTLMDLARARDPRFDNRARAADDLAALLYTSGTTGRSKGAMLSHGNLLSNAQVLADAWRFDEDDILIHALPLFHTHGLFVATNVTLAAGSSMILLPKFDPDRIVAEMPRATVLMGVPTFYVRLLQHAGVNRDSTRGMRLFVSGSAPLLAETHERWRDLTGHAILERYGMTETNMNASNPYESERRPGTVGLPLPGISVRVTDPDTGRPMAPGEVGMIEVRGPNVFKGYWRMPEKTKAEFREDGHFITGDIGMIDADGYVHIVGRGKDLIIAGGYNVYPREVELLIDAVDGVEESAVIGLPHPDLGEGITAVVVRSPDAEVEAAGILAELSAHLARFKHPRHVIFVEELPRNTMGKVQKNVLRDRYADLYRSPPA